MRKATRFLFSVVTAILAITVSASGRSIEPTGRSVAGEVLVKIRSSASPNAVSGIEQAADADQSERLATLQSGTVWRVHSRSMSVGALANALAKNPNVEYVEPNYIVKVAASPNDPSYGNQYALHNTGQLFFGSPGLPGADIDVERAWDITTGSASIVVGVVDTGVDYNHPDLAANMWSNPGGIGDAACGAGTHGFNAITRTCDPMDDSDHGTHVAGTIGAVGNNGLGVAGVNWTSSIMALKFLDSSGHGTTANAIAAIDFAVRAKLSGVNVRVLNNSWSGEAFSKALLDEINKVNENDILFVAAVGNGGHNVDQIPAYPASYGTPNMIAVAATDMWDNLSYLSNYGATRVHLAAPGISTFSTTRGGTYGYLQGTSMASPHVAGVAALVLAQTPSLTTAALKDAILGSTDPLPRLAGTTATGGRLNAARALGAPLLPYFTIAATPASQTVLQGAATTFTIAITPVNGFSGPVTLSTINLPGGLTASFSPNPATTTSSLTVNTSTFSSPTTSIVQISGVSGGEGRATTAMLSIVTTLPDPVCSAFVPVNYLSVPTPAALAAADFNLDGHLDLAAANVEAGTVSVSLGTATGSFLSQPATAAGTTPIALSTGDFNRDGKPDVAVANAGSNELAILLGTGNGALDLAGRYPVGTSPFSVATGDVDRDGIQDLIVANNGESSISILLGNGDGTFQSAVSHPVGSGPYWVSVADLDRNGTTDLIVANRHDQTVSILLGLGDGTFSAAVDYGTDNGPSSIATGDFDGDGFPDLAVSAYDSSVISILSNDGDGSFTATSSHAVATGPISVAAGDFDGDGTVDLAVSGDVGAMSILIGNGDGTFATALTVTTPDDANQIVTGDFDRDGKTDFVVAAERLLTVYRNTGACGRNCGTFSSNDEFAVGVAPVSMTASDFNGDGMVDLAIANRDDNTVSLQLGNGDGTFYAGASGGTGTIPSSILSGDFNRDGAPDLATANESGNVSVLIGNGDGTFGTAVSYAAGTMPRAIAQGDFNRDGRTDLAVANGDSDDVSLLLGNGDGTFGSATTLAVGWNPSALAVGDLDRDGNADLAVANADSENVSILLGNGDGTFATASSLAAGTAPSAIAIADFNRDGKPDLAVANRGSNDLWVLGGLGDGTFQTATQFAAGTSPDAIAAADLDGDGWPDLALANFGSNDVTILFGTFGGFRAGPVANPGTGPASIVATDFDRDGKPDLATANRAANSISILRNHCPVPDLTISKSHAGTFTQGDQGKTYTVVVTNDGALATEGTVTVTDVLPNGLLATAISGSGWTCGLPTLSCTRSDTLAAGNSYPPITVTVNVSSSAAASVTNTVTVSGGDQTNTGNDSASDVTTIDQVTDIVISKSHAGGFTQGATGATFTIRVHNQGGSATSGTVTVHDALPTGMIATSMSGSGWTCTLGSLTCTRSDSLPARSAYPPIKVVVKIAANAPAFLTNTATVSGGGDAVLSDNTASDSVTIWKSNTCGAFADPLFLPEYRSRSAIAAADLNHDGKTDLVTAEINANAVHISFGHGDGTMADAISYAVGPYPKDVEIADLNLDGHPDLVVLNQSTVSVLLGNGSGSFAAAINQAAGATPTRLAIGDFDGDGIPDVAVANGGTVSILLGNGNGTLQPPLSHPLTYSAVDLAVADFDHDGNADLIAATSNGALMLLGNGDGTFAAGASYGTSYYRNVSAVDVDEDGNADAIFSYGSGIVVHLGNGNGTLQAEMVYPGTYSDASLAIDDVNGDGHADAVSAENGGMSVYLGNGDGSFQQARNRSVLSTWVVIADFNHDGHADIGFSTSYGYAGVLLAGCSDLVISKSHSGDFKTAQKGAAYQLFVSNQGDAAAVGTVTVTDHLPDGMTATSMYGNGWTCNTVTVTCTTSLSLMGGASYQKIQLVVDISNQVPENVTNTATVSGGDDSNPANNTASDPTTIIQAPELRLSMSHSGVFAQGETGKTYTIVVVNNGAGPTTAAVQVQRSMQYLPATAIAGPGWNCSINSSICTRFDPIPPGEAAPPITVTVNVEAAAPASITPSATVYTLGEGDSSNNTGTDPTNILVKPTLLAATAMSGTQVNLIWQPVMYATGYQVLRSSNNGPFNVIGSPVAYVFTDTTVTPNTAYVYKVRALAGTTVGLLGAPDLASTFSFTDATLVVQATTIRSVHITQLRSAVNAVRAAAGLAPASFTNGGLTGGFLIRGVHVQELRNSLDEARAVLGMPTISYTDPSLVAGTTRIKATHIRELRTGVQ